MENIFVSMITISVIFISLVVLDYIWLGKIVKKFIIKEFRELVEVKNNILKINLYYGISSWIVISIGTYFFVVSKVNTSFEALITGALFGFVVYGVYELTNLTFIKKYPVKFSIVDIIWGIFLCSIISTIGFLTISYLIV